MAWMALAQLESMAQVVRMTEPTADDRMEVLQPEFEAYLSRQREVPGCQAR